MRRAGFERWVLALTLGGAAGIGGLLAVYPDQWAALLCGIAGAVTALLSAPACMVGFVVSRALGATASAGMATTFAKAWGVGIGVVLVPQILAGWVSERHLRKRPRTENIILGGFLVAAAFSGFFADDIVRYGADAARVARAVALMYVASFAVREWRHLAWVMWAIILTSGAASALGLAQVGAAAVRGEAEAMGRGMSATFGWVGEAAVMTVLGAAIAMWGVGQRGRARRVVSAGALAACVLGTVFTTQRSALFGLVLVVALSVLVAHARTRRRQLILVALVLAMLPPAILLTPPRLRKWYSPKYIIGANSTLNRRVQMAEAGWGMLRAYPAGVGLGNDALHYEEFKAPGDLSPWWPQHNVFMQVAVTTGWAGGLCFLAFVALAFARAWRAEAILSRKQDHAGAAMARSLWVATVGMLSFGLFHSTFLPNAYFWLTLGLMWRVGELARAPEAAMIGAPLSLVPPEREAGTPPGSAIAGAR